VEAVIFLAGSIPKTSKVIAEQRTVVHIVGYFTLIQFQFDPQTSYAGKAQGRTLN
jgi:hypothetical protein